MMVVAVVVGILRLFKRCKGDSRNPHYLVWGSKEFHPIWQYLIDRNCLEHCCIRKEEARPADAGLGGLQVKGHLGYDVSSRLACITE